MLVSAFAVSCESASVTYIKGFENFVSKVERDGSNYTKEEWEQKDVEFKKYIEAKYDKVANELTSNDKKKVGELTARYYKVRAKAYGEDVIDSIEDGIDYLGGFVNGLLGTHDNNDSNENKDK